MTKLYLAYGSNLNKRQMASRCPTARPVGSAMIYGWELCFRGVADIIKSNVTFGQYVIFPMIIVMSSKSPLCTPFHAWYGPFKC